MTGESLPVDKTIGDEVFCGTINRFGSIDIAATKVGKDSSLQKLIRIAQDTENKQAPMQRIAVCVHQLCGNCTLSFATTQPNYRSAGI